jgi:hypothetical protein
MEAASSPKHALESTDFSKLSGEELVETIQKLIKENKSLNQRIQYLEKIVDSSPRHIDLVNSEPNSKSDLTLAYTKTDEESVHKGEFFASTVYETPPTDMTKLSDDGKDNFENKEKEDEADSPEEVDNEAYFQQMTAIIRDMAKSPSMILSKNEADFIMGQITKTQKVYKEKCDIKMWERDIVPFFPDKDLKERTKARIKANIYNFIPAKYRCKAWPLLIGNPLKIKRSIYDQYCTLLEKNPIDPQVSYLIKEDLVRTYPTFKSFNKGEALNSELQCLLELFHFARPDIGYVQGMAYPASMLLLHMDRYHAFKCLVNMIASSPFLICLYNFKLDRLKLVFNGFYYYLKQKCPAAHKHLMKMNVQAETFLVEWYYTLFCRTFTIHDAAQIWDVYFAEGEVVFLRVALRIFQAIEPQLIKKNFSQTLQYIRSCTTEIDIDTIFKNMQYSKMTPDRLERFYEKEKKLSWPEAS